MAYSKKTALASLPTLHLKEISDDLLRSRLSGRLLGKVSVPEQSEDTDLKAIPRPGCNHTTGGHGEPRMVEALQLSEISLFSRCSLTVEDKI